MTASKFTEVLDALPQPCLSPSDVRLEDILAAEVTLQRPSTEGSGSSSSGSEKGNVTTLKHSGTIKKLRRLTMGKKELL
ncbi:MAG: hypothetical protein M1819_001492 [Sarea resinae]|nr:MAG: hypothetical protein M1819_001492 [Sarea resinae]